MLDRRTALKFAALGAAGTLLSYSRGTFSPSAHSPKRNYRAVYDSRFTEGRKFGAQLRELGVRTTATQGDVVALWYRDIQTDLSEGTEIFAGLTDPPTLFCLQELARDLRLRLVFRADHVLDENAQLTLPASIAGPANRPVYPQKVGQFMAHLIHHSHFETHKNKRLQTAASTNGSTGQGALVTWVLA